MSSTNSYSEKSSNAEHGQDSNTKSKTQLKKEMTDLQKLGETLTTFTNKKLNKLPLPEILLTAINEFNRLPNSHGARKRQAQYIGRVMRDCDHEAIKLAIDNLELGSNRSSIQQSLEQLCDQLLTSVDQQINTLVTQFPNLERQKLRQLCRDCNKANAEKKQFYREKIIRYLGTLDQETD